MRRIPPATRSSSQSAKNRSDHRIRIVPRIAVDYQRTDNVPTLQRFVSARLADLTTAGGLTIRARDACRTVVSAAVTARSTPQPAAAASRRPNYGAAKRPNYIVIGHDLPLISPGVERC
jgi:hypothetical protein